MDRPGDTRCCERCGADVGSGVAFCSRCGAATSPGRSAPMRPWVGPTRVLNAEEIECGCCASRLRSADAYCHKCGVPVRLLHVVVDPDFEDVARVIPKQWFGPFARSPDCRFVLVWESAGPQSTRLVLARHGQIAVSLDLREPCFGAVANSGSFLILEVPGGGPHCVARLYDVAGNVLFEQEYRALPASTALSGDGSVAALSFRDGATVDCGQLVLLCLRNRRERWRVLTPPSRLIELDTLTDTLLTEHGAFRLSTGRPAETTRRAEIPLIDQMRKSAIEEKAREQAESSLRATQPG